MSSDAPPPRPAWRAAFAAPGVPQALVVVLLLLVLRAFDPALIDEIRLQSFDLEQRLAPRQHVTLPVTIVTIDEASLKPPYGQWPWARTIVADLVRRIAAGGPAALGVDMIFSEPDRASPEQLRATLPQLPPPLADALAALPHNDTVLAAAFKAAPTVLGVGPGNPDQVEPPAPFAPTIIRGIGGDPKPFLPTFAKLVRSLPELTAAERSAAALVGNPDADGILRRVPLFIVGDGNLIATLTLEMLRIGNHVGGLGIAVTPGGIEGGRLLNFPLPTDSEGRAYPYFAPPGSVTTVSASDILDGTFDTKLLAGNYVLLGVTGLGLVDVKQTPLGLMQGIEVHAQLLESILTDQILRRPAMLAPVEIGLTLILGLVVIFGLSYHRPRPAAGALAGIVILMLGGGFLAFRYDHLLVDGVYPSLASIMIFGVMLAANLRVAQADRLRLAAQLEREKEAKLRLEAELSAARAIQMGLLPRALGASDETGAIDLHALIESARMVGGDLYDFMMIDQRHLFFAIADVSGKGIAAALFMAMTKEVLHGATLRHGAALDRVFAEANVKIRDASTEAEAGGARPTFVTIFAGVLDLAAGTLAYVSAGHDSPYVLRAVGSPFRLDTAGGPPLGWFEDTPYPVDHATLAPGDVMVLFTDGVTEARNGATAFYGGARLKDVLAAAPAASAKIVVDHVREDVRLFVGEAEQADDLTLLAIRWRGPSG